MIEERISGSWYSELTSDPPKLRIYRWSDNDDGSQQEIVFDLKCALSFRSTLDSYIKQASKTSCDDIPISKRDCDVCGIAPGYCNCYP